MTLQLFTREEKIDAIQRQIGFARRGRTDPATIEILNSILDDYRARRPGVANSAVNLFRRRLQVLKDTKTPTGYLNGQMVSLAQEFVSRWPLIRQALEQFEGKNTNEAG